ncbi:galactosyldiacylglycerol synthase [Kroppenstedtia pulmonis]|uniref:Galactosyldiacylglycerol synthase n=1 Tax=Kroppenstedtia pulmonis TaxID=1380685 RepID=A0A7D4CDH7_9BACL|nr:glycosyltransferase [Kroppenstedtia pulmonis]QKG83414.1 galactosyldiacylglycerol synthase [Kroppenstedtia pulmonis]
MMDRVAHFSGLTDQEWLGLRPARVERKSILFVSENFGSGHTRAAEALARGIEEADPRVQVQLVELGRELRPQVSQALLYSYLGVIQKAPKLWRKVYGRHHQRSFPRWMEWCLHQTLYSHLSEYVQQFQPRVVVSTHPFASAGIARIKKEGYPIRLCTVITDFSAHGYWVNGEVDLYLVPYEGVRDQLIEMGVNPRCIAVTGIPTDDRFWKGKKTQDARAHLQLKNMPTVLILGGGLGMGRTEDLVRMAAKWKEQLQIVVCTGRNQKLLNSLKQKEEFHHPHIHLKGYTEVMADWMDAADIILTKPGGMTCSEAIAKGKPLLLYGSIPGHEEKNSQFMVRNGLAKQVSTEEDLDCWLHQLLTDKNCLVGVREKMLHWRRQIHPSKSVQAVLDLLTPSSGY